MSHSSLVHMLYTGPPHDEIELASQGSTGFPMFNELKISATSTRACPSSASSKAAIVEHVEQGGDR